MEYLGAECLWVTVSRYEPQVVPEIKIDFRFSVSVQIQEMFQSSELPVPRSFRGGLPAPSGTVNLRGPPQESIKSSLCRYTQMDVDLADECNSRHIGACGKNRDGELQGACVIIMADAQQNHGREILLLHASSVQALQET